MQAEIKKWDDIFMRVCFLFTPCCFILEMGRESRKVFNWQLAFLFLSPFSSFYCLTKAGEDFVECSFFWSKETAEEEWGRERGGVSVRERLGCAEEEVEGRGGGSAPIHIGGIWLENIFLRGLEKFSSGELARNGGQTSRRTGTWWMFEPTKAETAKEAAR